MRWPASIFDVESSEVTFTFKKSTYFCISAYARVFTALHAMQTRSSDENSVCPSVRLSVCLSVRPSVRHTRAL